MNCRNASAKMNRVLSYVEGRRIDVCPPLEADVAQRITWYIFHLFII